MYIKKAIVHRNYMFVYNIIFLCFLQLYILYLMEQVEQYR